MILSAMLLAGCSGQLFAQGGGKCTNPTFRAFIYPTATLPDGINTVPSAILGDGNWYTNGNDVDAAIQVCSGTYDAVLNVLVSKRKLTFKFPAPIPNSFVDTQIPAGSYVRNGWINVRNLLCKTCTVDPKQPFTTHVGIQIASLVNRRDFQLRYMPLAVQAPDLHIDPSILPEENTPFSTSPALVIPLPYDCDKGGATKPAWIVRGTLTSTDPLIPAGYTLQVGTAHDNQQTTRIRAGQYSMPFELRIEALQCTTY
jgi:hypothetical protein